VEELAGGAMPENSATVVPKLASAVARIARAVTLRLKFSRMRPASPRPVTTDAGVHLLHDRQHGREDDEEPPRL